MYRLFNEVKVADYRKRSRTRWQVSYFSASLEKVLESEEEREGKKRVR